MLETARGEIDAVAGHATRLLAAALHLIPGIPPHGVAVGAKAEIHRLLDELACQGLALLVISSELPGIMNLSRRIIVMRDGGMAGELERVDFSQPALLRLMAGVEARAA